MLCLKRVVVRILRLMEVGFWRVRRDVRDRCARAGIEMRVVPDELSPGLVDVWGVGGGGGLIFLLLCWIGLDSMELVDVHAFLFTVMIILSSRHGTMN